ncbi:MAG: ATP-binding protein [Proteobacteria bacterium]|nr:ATP-binding protein [Pseudomonadota bacterium]
MDHHSLAVIDSGAGMGPESVDACTQSYWRGVSSEGHGIGLSIVRSLSERFGWRLRIDSRVGVGTSAHLYF